MNKELYVSSTPHETRVALVEDDQLAEVFFERENEYTLAGSIYKGRVTRVLPGMQSAFVDIGLERDAFLYVSDFLEVGGEEDDEEFGQIPTPRVMVDLRQQSAPPAPEARAATTEAEEEYEAESGAEDYPAPDSDNGQAEAAAEDEAGAAAGEDDESGEGARRWRGRRRRGGRRGRGEERPERSPRSENTSQAPNETSSETPSGPPSGYTPMVLPGESISKYRDRAQHSADETASAHAKSAPRREDAEPHAEASFVLAQEEAEEAVESSTATTVEASDLGQGRIATEPEQLEWAAAGAHRSGEEHAPHTSAHDAETDAVSDAATEHGSDYDYDTETVFEAAERQDLEDQADAPASSAEPSATLSHRRFDFEPPAKPESSGEDEWESVDFAAEQTVAHTQPEGPLSREYEELLHSHPAPSTAPEGRTLEHETLDEEETEFHPVPEDLGALSEAAADSDLDLIEETLDAGNGHGERWLPKIADVDEDEVLAAEMRGETYQITSDDEERRRRGGRDQRPRRVACHLANHGISAAPERTPGL